MCAPKRVILDVLRMYVPYHVQKKIVKLNGVDFKSKPIKIEDAKVKPKTRSQQYKIFGNSSNNE